MSEHRSERDTVTGLRIALQLFTPAHIEAEYAYRAWNELDTQLREATLALETEIANELDAAGKPRWSNETKRRVELDRRLKAEHSDLVDLHSDATAEKRSRQADLERIAEELKTYRTLVAYETAALQFEAVAATSAALLNRSLS